MQRAIRRFYRAFNNAHRLEIASYRSILSNDVETPYELTGKTVDLNLISQVVDVREPIICFHEIELKLKPTSYARIINRSLGPFADVNTIFNRTLELRYKATLYNNLFKRLEFDRFRKIWEHKHSFSDVLNRFIDYCNEFSNGKRDASYLEEESRRQHAEKLLHDVLEKFTKFVTPFRRPVLLHGKTGLQIKRRIKNADFVFLRKRYSDADINFDIISGQECSPEAM